MPKQSAIEAAKRIAEANHISVRQVMAKFHSAVKKRQLSRTDFLLPVK